MTSRNGNGVWQKISIALVMLILGTVVASGYMSCQYSTLAEEFDTHIATEQAKDVEQAKTMGRIEEWMESIDRRLGRLEEK